MYPDKNGDIVRWRAQNLEENPSESRRGQDLKEAIRDLVAGRELWLLDRPSKPRTDGGISLLRALEGEGEHLRTELDDERNEGLLR